MDDKHMNRLSSVERVRILQLLCEGQSIRAINRSTGVSKNTVTKLLVDTGAACMTFHDANVRTVKVTRIQIDETFTYTKQDNVNAPNTATSGAEDVWTWTAVEANSQLILSFLVGGRDTESAMRFMDDLQSRLVNRVRLISDGRKISLEAVDGEFTSDIDYNILHEVYGAAPKSAKGKPSPAECISAEKYMTRGARNSRYVSTPYIERSKQTVPMHMRSSAHSTNASMKIENHTYAAALHVMYHNFVRVHSKFRISSAMAAGVSKKLWKIGDIVALVKTEEAKNDLACGSHKKKPLGR